MNEFLKKKNVINLLLLGIMVLAVPLTVKLARQQQILFSRAAEAKVEFLGKDLGGTDCVISRNSKQVAVCKDLTVRFTAPTGADIKPLPRVAPPPISSPIQSFFLPRGLVSTVYAGHLGYEANFCEGSSIVHEYADGTHEVQHNCEDNKVCKALPNNDAGCEAKSIPPPPPPPGPQHECASDGDRSEESKDSSVPNCRGRQTCHYEGDTLKWGGYRCEVCTNGATNPPDCNDQNKTDHSCDSFKNNLQCGDKIVEQTCKNGVKNGDNCEVGPNPDCNPSSCPRGPTCKTDSAGKITQAQAECVVGERGDIIPFYRDNGWCTDKKEYYPGIINNWEGINGASEDAIINRCAGGTGTSCVARFQKNDQDPWVPSKTINKGESVFAGALNPNTSQYVSGATLTLTGPNVNTTLQKEVSYTPPAAGNYTLTVNGGGCTNATATLTVSETGGICFTCNASKKWTRQQTGAGNCQAANPPVCDSKSTNTYPDGCTGGDAKEGDSCGGTGDEKKACYICDTSKPASQQRRQWTDKLYTAAECATQNGRTGQPSHDSSQSLCTTTPPTSPPTTPPTVPPTAPPVVITAYRFAQSPTDLEQAPFKPFTGGQGAIEQITLSDTASGQNKSVWVQFKTSNGDITERAVGNIFYAGPDPVITGSTCDVRHDIKDGSLIFTVAGDNFGNRDFGNSKLAADTTNLDEIKEWTNQRVSARMVNPPDTSAGKTFIVNLTRADGVKASSSCSIDTTQISFGAKLFCRAPSNFDQDNIQLTVVQNALGIGSTASLGVGLTAPTTNFKAGSKVKETVTISKEGVIPSLKTKLQKGLEYIVCIKAPKSLRLCSKPFPAVNGNNIIHKFDLPVGDVNDDDVINTADASICKGEWGPGKNKKCEFNRDSVTNSFEWSCLLHNFNDKSQGEPE